MSIPVAVYPYCAEVLPLVKTFAKLQDNYEINSLISPNGFGLTGRDAGYVCNNPEVGLIVSDEFNYKDAEWTTLILLEPIMVKEQVDYSYETITEQAVLHGKHVIFLSASLKVDDKIRKLSELYSNQVEIRSYIQSNGNCSEEEPRFHDIEVPVILVGGVLEEADSFEVLLQLSVKLKTDNMNPLVFTKHPMGALLGFHSMNHIWNNTGISEAQKIKEINSYINYMVEEERPGIILLEAPDAVMRYNDYAVNGFGIRTYMLCQAVTPDRFVCCTPFGLSFENFLNQISLKFEKTLGTPITSVHVSNVFIDYQDLIQKHNISFMYCNQKFVRERLKIREHSQIPIHSVVLDGIDELYSDLFEDEN